MRTLRPIAFDEALTISYVVQPMPVFARRAHLQSTYRFWCDCSRCTHEAQLCDPAATAAVERAWELVQSGAAERSAGDAGNAEALYREALTLVSGSGSQSETGHHVGSGAAVRALAYEGLARVALSDHRWRAAISMLERSFENGCGRGCPQDGGRWQGSTDHLEGLRAAEIWRLQTRLGDSVAAKPWAELGMAALRRTHGCDSAALSSLAKELAAAAQNQPAGSAEVS